MMNLKETMNFTKLREKGPAGLDLKNDEVIQLITRDSEIKVIITQEYFFNLLATYNDVLIRNGLKQEKRINIEDKLVELEEEMREMFKLVQEDKDKEECKTTGRKIVGNF
jgi:hypothetical protein